MPVEDLKNKRIEKLNNFLKSGIDPYPSVAKRDYFISDVIRNFKKLAGSRRKVFVAGRIRELRLHGGLTFAKIEDGTDRIQILLTRNNLKEEKYKLFRDNLDIGDFVGAKGLLFLTKQKEKTLEVKDVILLSKSLRPIPTDWYGFSDTEERFRRRYLDLLINEDIRKRFVKRSEIIAFLRDYINKEGFLEVETPILQNIYGGAAAKPFVSHFNALDIDLYLRIAPELYLKRLLVAGFEKVYEIGKSFRNEGMDREHNPEFTTLELYAAYFDYKQLMEFTEKLFAAILKKFNKSLKLKCGEKIIDFSQRFKKIDLVDLVKKYTGIDFEQDSEAEIEEKVKKLKIDIQKNVSGLLLIDSVFKKICRPKIINPTFVTDHLIAISPLAKKLKENPKRAARFQLVINGMEVVNGFSELNDPRDQAERFNFQEKLRAKGDEEASRFDADFVEALEYGMPPAAGLGLGIDRLMMLLTNTASIREVILFPTMKPK